MTREEKNACKSLAVCYEAYMERYHKGDKKGMETWGTMLEEAQERTGVTLLSMVVYDRTQKKEYENV